MDIKTKKLGIIGLGYVGLPLAVEFGKNGYEVIGFDINQPRIQELQKNIDATLEVTTEEMKEATGLSYSYNLDNIKDCDIYIVTVPTPIDQYKTPDLTPLKKASETVGKVISKGNIVIYESTVYPGCTEEECIPVVEKTANLKFNTDFFAGYSPERINPGDHVHRVHNIMKVTSGSTPEIADIVDSLYASIVTVGTHKASCLKVAEAAKVIENSQRDLNIAFVNELSKIFDKVGIDTLEVLEAAGTKWNFLPFRPGLVGGHCIGVDPYYLTYKSEALGYHPEVILAGRRINDSMGPHVANQVIKLMLKEGHSIKKNKVLVLGITFKEDCPDIRNSRVIDVIQEFQEFGVDLDVYDPYASKEEVKEEYGIDLIDSISSEYSAIVLTVSHAEFKNLDWAALKTPSTIIYDVKSVLPKELISDRL
ncbi:nucleotide sugar dehydrogenase [Flammeovirga pectinis]|uniref:Nucleotide sugar dehydrogenase n=1 Tax=Flammeovirga pectinis TaxID=2494373 RepID=A0A3S9P051_9BACT|nr:nucleotide sugar dehydrogenase [Flammeovirga pectinis]AZQ61557.1 nucleotide sugar dehydrogenase [Flammeovirga pectinis]